MAQNAGGTADDVSKSIFDVYVDAGGNFIDTADVYSGGYSEELIGKFVSDNNLRDQLVLATKFGFNGQNNNPNGGGNGRKNLHRALEGSLRRLQTDYIDLYWMHVWDGVTPVEEILQSLADLVKQGKIRYFGFSNLPAWFTAKAATLAAVHALPGPVALQTEYSLVERNIENEFVPLAKEFGLGITPWSPLAGGFLTGKYQRAGQVTAGDGRLNGSNPFQDLKFTEHNWQVLDVLQSVANEAAETPAKVALAWAAAQPGITSLILGASSVDQLNNNLASLDVTLTEAQIKALNDVSALKPTYPYGIFTPQVSRSIFGGKDVSGY